MSLWLKTVCLWVPHLSLPHRATYPVLEIIWRNSAIALLRRGGDCHRKCVIISSALYLSGHITCFLSFLQTKHDHTPQKHDWGSSSTSTDRNAKEVHAPGESSFPHCFYGIIFWPVPCYENYSLFKFYFKMNTICFVIELIYYSTEYKNWYQNINTLRTNQEDHL